MITSAPFRRTARAVVLAGLFCGAAPAAFAQAIPTASTAPSGVSQEQALSLAARLDALEQRNAELEDQIADLKAQVAAGEGAIREEVHAAPSVSLNNGRPTFTSADGQFSASLRGIIQLDAALYDQRAAGPLATDFRRGSYGDASEADHARDLSDGANFRRARIGVEGKAFGDWNYNLILDFGGGPPEDAGKISSAWVEYAGLRPLRVRVGAFSPPSGIEEATSTTGGLFLERASPSELVRSIASGDGRKAAGVFANGERWNLSGALSGNIVGTSTFDHQLAFVGRAAFLPIRGQDYLVHLGANTEIVIDPAKTGPDVPGGAASPLRLRDRPEIRVDGARLVDTGNIDADGLTSVGVEIAAQWRVVHLQSEYYRIEVNRRASALADPRFSGWYLQGAWTLTGEPRRYNIATATFDPPKVEHPFRLTGGGPNGSWGVWELAARYSDLDLNYRAGATGTAPTPSTVRGGEQKIVTLGVNWYPNSVVRLQADYQHVDVDRLSPGGTAFGAGALTPPAGAQIGQTLNIWSLRTQYAF